MWTQERLLCLKTFSYTLSHEIIALSKVEFHLVDNTRLSRMDGCLNEELEKLAAGMGLDIHSREFACAMDKQDPHHHLRQMFFYPKMKELPHGQYSVNPTKIQLPNVSC